MQGSRGKVWCRAGKPSRGGPGTVERVLDAWKRRVDPGSDSGGASSSPVLQLGAVKWRRRVERGGGASGEGMGSRRSREARRRANSGAEPTHCGETAVAAVQQGFGEVGRGR